MVVLDRLRLPEDALSVCLSLPFARFERFISGEFDALFAAFVCDTFVSLSRWFPLRGLKKFCAFGEREKLKRERRERERERGKRKIRAEEHAHCECT